MIEPISSGIVSAITSKGVGHLWSYIAESDNPEETWKGAAQECVVQARISYKQNYENISGVNRSDLQTDVGHIGESARELQIRGDINDFDSELVELLGDFAEICGEYSQAAQLHGGSYLSKFSTQLDNIGGDIIEITQDS
jgi:hypothetical protein